MRRHRVLIDKKKIGSQNQNFKIHGNSFFFNFVPLLRKQGARSNIMAYAENLSLLHFSFHHQSKSGISVKQAVHI